MIIKCNQFCSLSVLRHLQGIKEHNKQPNNAKIQLLSLHFRPAQKVQLRQQIHSNSTAQQVDNPLVVITEVDVVEVLALDLWSAEKRDCQGMGVGVCVGGDFVGFKLDVVVSWYSEHDVIENPVERN